LNFSKKLIATREFNSARRITEPVRPEFLNNLHGHSFKAKIRWESDNYDDYSEGDQKLAKYLAEINYSYLNKVINNPTDLNIAKWLADKEYSSQKLELGVQSTDNQGVDMIVDGQYYAWKAYWIHAAHQLPYVPDGHKCKNMHGHNFKICVYLKGSIDDSNMCQKYHWKIDLAWKKLENILNYSCLNQISGLENPTSEILARWVWRKIALDLENLDRVIVFETATSGAVYDGENFSIWKEMSFDSATKYRANQSQHTASVIHGYTYKLRIFFQAPLDILFGWTIDYGEIKEQFRPIYSLVDHQNVDDLSNIDGDDCLSLASWILDKTIQILPNLSRLELYQTKGCGVILNSSLIDFYLPE